MKTYLLLSLLGLSGCLLSDLDLTEKPCPCGPGLTCDTANNVCVTSLDPLDAGRPDAAPSVDAAVPDAGPLTCIRDLDCTGDEICAEGFCQPRCDRANGTGCNPPLTCEEETGRCTPPAETCAVANDCALGPPTQICVDGSCEWGCTIRGQECAPSRQCDLTTGRCEARQICTQDTDCGDPFYVCASGGYCTARCDAPGSLGTRCLRDSVCEDTGRCSLRGIGEFCTTGAECNTGTCLTIFFQGDTFPFCTEACGASQDCPIGRACGEQVGGAKACIIPEAVGSEDGPFDGAPGSSCSLTASEVCQSSKCINSACAESCTHDRHCENLGFADRFTCQGISFSTPMGPETQMACQPESEAVLPIGFACLTNDQCQSGLCDTETDVCVTPCCSELDCQRNERCEIIPGSITACRTSTSTGAFLNAPCTQDEDCESGLCSFDSPTFTPVCTTFCCTHEDCAILGPDAQCLLAPGPIGGIASICVQPRSS